MELTFSEPGISEVRFLGKIFEIVMRKQIVSMNFLN